MYSKPLLIREPVTSLGLPHKPGVDSPDAGCQCQPDPQHDSVLPAADDSWDPSRFLLGPAAKNFRGEQVYLGVSTRVLRRYRKPTKRYKLYHVMVQRWI